VSRLSQNFRGEDRRFQRSRLRRFGVAAFASSKATAAELVARANLGLDLEALHQRAPV